MIFNGKSTEIVTEIQGIAIWRSENAQIGMNKEFDSSKKSIVFRIYLFFRKRIDNFEWSNVSFMPI